MPLECECFSLPCYMCPGLGQTARNEISPVTISGASSIYAFIVAPKGNDMSYDTNSWCPRMQGMELSLSAATLPHTLASLDRLWSRAACPVEAKPYWSWRPPWDFLGHYSSDKLLRLRGSSECVFFCCCCFFFIKRDITRRLSLQGLRNHSFRVSFLAKEILAPTSTRHICLGIFT